MRTELLEAVARIITVHCYWIRVIDITEHMRYCILRDEHLMPITSRCLTLEVTHSRGCYYVGHKWQVPEIDLDQVLSEMLHETPKLHQRCRSLSITPEDVETLVERASHGVIKLDMIEDDYTPIIYRH